ncbi:hypothetical protein K432DRAFT_359147, partial [Lepidopterella palustris CBS 459.81]
MFVQLCGILHALVTLHNYKDEKNWEPKGHPQCRHGDLKPENILVFSDNSHDRSPGSLVITDMGLARFHTNATPAQVQMSLSPSGTTRYEPPEASTNAFWRLSRRYDVWSMGGIMLEFLIWFLYGNQQRVQFVLATNTTLYNPSDHTRLQPVVDEVFKTLEADGRCSEGTAFRGLVSLIKTRLLVHKMLVQAPASSLAPPALAAQVPRSFTSQTSGSSGGKWVEDNSCRARSIEVYNKIEVLCAQGRRDPNSLFTIGGKKAKFLIPNHSNGHTYSTQPPGQGYGDYTTSVGQSTRSWTIRADDERKESVRKCRARIIFGDG